MFKTFAISQTHISLLSKANKILTLVLSPNILKNKVFIVILVFITIAQIFLIYNGGSLFRTYGLKINELIFVILLAFTVIPLDLIRKLFIKYR